MAYIVSLAFFELLWVRRYVFIGRFLIKSLDMICILYPDG